MTPFDSAIEEWRAIVGAPFLTLDPAALADASTATFPTSGEVAAILRPADRDQVQACVQVANRWRVPVYPVSSGKNWGYGSRAPHLHAFRAAMILLDRLDAITHFDPQLALITVQPGVTFTQAQSFLSARAPHLLLNAPGSSPRASVIGNTLERGFAAGLYAPSIDYTANLEVVLPDGSLIHTGFSRFANARAAHKHGVGVSLNGLFAQSNLGIVTQMTLFLAPRPAYHEYVTFTIRSAERLPPLIDALQSLKLTRLIETNIALFNDYKLLASVRQHPDPPHYLDLANAPPEIARFLAGTTWAGECSITAQTAEIGLMIRRHLRDTLEGVVDTLDFLPPNAPNPMFESATVTDLASVYWRKRTPPGDDPDRDRCGVIWFAPVAPFRGADVARCIQIIHEGMTAHAFEPIISVQCLDARSCLVLAALVYDREAAGQDEAAMRCFEALMAAAAGEGFYPYRLGLQGMTSLPEADDDTVEAIRRIKGALDPADILAPSRYDFRHQWNDT